MKICNDTFQQYDAKKCAIICLLSLRIFSFFFNAGLHIDYCSFSLQSISLIPHSYIIQALFSPSVLFNQLSQHYKSCARTKNRQRNQWNLKKKKSFIFFK